MFCCNQNSKTHHHHGNDHFPLGAYLREVLLGALVVFLSQPNTTGIWLYYQNTSWQTVSLEQKWGK